MARASEFDFGAGFRLLTCSAEDLIVLKAFASRPQDWIDIDAVVLRQQRVLDWKLVFTSSNRSRRCARRPRYWISCGG